MTFSIDTFRKLFTPYNGTLLHIGKLTNLFESGFNYDNAKNEDQQIKYINEIIEQTSAESDKHAFVIWSWVKYFTE